MISQVSFSDDRILSKGDKTRHLDYETEGERQRVICTPTLIAALFSRAKRGSNPSIH